MKKKTIYQITAGVIVAIILGIVGWISLANYGGNNCGQPPASTCDCFCCHMFNSRGYEACAALGFWSGIVSGAILGVLIIRLIWQKLFNHKESK